MCIVYCASTRIYFGEKMLGCATATTTFLVPIPHNPKPLFNNSFITRFPFQNPSSGRKKLIVLAEKEGNGREKQDPNQKNNQQEDVKKDQRSILNFSWKDVLNPDPENIVAVGLTGLLTWASVQVLCQLFFISLAILLAALKYSFIAALLLFILITLL